MKHRLQNTVDSTAGRLEIIALFFGICAYVSKGKIFKKSLMFGLKGIGNRSQESRSGIRVVKSLDTIWNTFVGYVRTLLTENYS